MGHSRFLVVAEIMEAMSPTDVTDMLMEKDNNLVLDNFDKLINTIPEMQSKPMNKTVDLRFGLEADAIKMKNFLEGNNNWFKDTFNVEVTGTSRMKEFVTVKLRSL